MRVALRTPMTGKLGQEFEQMFDRLLVPRFLTEPLLPPFPVETTGAEWIPVMDIVETPAEYIVRLEVPGIHKENLDINLTGTLPADELTRLLQGTAADKDKLDKLLRATNAQLDELGRQKAAAEARAATYKSLTDRLRSMIDAGKLSVKIRKGRMLISLPNDVLFDSGSAVLKRAGQDAIAQVAQALAGISDRQFLVAGHTDDRDPALRRKLAEFTQRTQNSHRQI